jgi:hypothetical protein
MAKRRSDLDRFIAYYLSAPLDAVDATHQMLAAVLRSRKPAKAERPRAVKRVQEKAGAATGAQG